MPGRAGRDQDDLLLDMILDRRPLPPDAPPGMHVLASKLVGLAVAPGGELPGEAAALAAFVRSGSPASTLTLAGGPSAGRRRRGLAAGRARLSAAVAVVVVGLSGTAAAAAYAGVLPATVQNFAHQVIGAPAARHGVQDGHGGTGQRPGHPGGPQPPSARGSAHPAKPGQHKGHASRGHRGRSVKPGTNAHRRHHRHPAGLLHPVRPSHSPGPKAG